MEKTFEANGSINKNNDAEVDNTYLKIQTISAYILVQSLNLYQSKREEEILMNSKREGMRLFLLSTYQSIFHIFNYIFVWVSFVSRNHYFQGFDNRK